jgi:hypothetical protein
MKTSRTTGSLVMVHRVVMLLVAEASQVAISLVRITLATIRQATLKPEARCLVAVALRTASHRFPMPS